MPAAAREQIATPLDPLDDGEPLRDEVVQQQLRLNTVAMLKCTGGKISGEGGAAQLLGLKPTTLASRLRKWNIDPRDFKPGRSEQ